MDLAEVLAATSRFSEPAREIEHAADLYRAKGSLVGLAQAEAKRRRLEIVLR